MKILFLSLVFLLSAKFCYAQDMNAPVNRNWMVFAEDTNLTFQQITHLCDSMFADAGFFAVDSIEDTTEQEDENRVGCWILPVVRMTKRAMFIRPRP
jgi:hypothetical protein